jgi:creatinine amidohydrolase/Fe(II)-dependent formamide hydrolase-like protein
MRKLQARFCAVFLFGVLPAAAQVGASPAAVNPDPNTPRPIAAYDSVFIDQLTWMEVRDALRAGKTTAIIATGGIEQSGPYLATGKHNYVLRATTEAIARKLGNALVAPIVPFVPEGNIDPPSGHMRYPGTVGVRPETFKLLLADIASCLRTQGFEHIILIGDHQANQPGLKEVAESLSAKWAGGRTTIHYIPEYYNNEAMHRFLEAHGIHEVDEGLHDEFGITAVMMSVDPNSVRASQRIRAGKFSINGVKLSPTAKTIAAGKQVVEYRAAVTVEAIRKSIGGRP